MDTLKIFVSGFWPPFIGALVGFFAVWLLRRSYSDAGFPFATRKAFAELSKYSEEEQSRFLREANTDALRHWRSFIPDAVIAVFFAMGSATAYTLPRITAIPDSWWVTLPVIVVFAALGGWLSAALTARYVRPFLKARLERSYHAA